MKLWTGPGMDPEVAMVRALSGVPVYVSEYVPRGEVAWLPGDDDEGPSITMHPLTLWAMRISLDLDEPMDSLRVQTQAIVCWVTERAEQMAAASIRGLNDMVRAFELRAEHYHLLRWCEQARDRHCYEQDADDFLLNVRQCAVCGQVATDESLVRSGAVR